MKQKKSKAKIVLTGGHAATTALAVCAELKRRSSGARRWEIYWIGAKRQVEGKDFPTIESQVLPRAGVKVYSIVTGRLQRKFTPWTIPAIARIPLGFFHALILLAKINPDIILSFGGFSAFPVVFVAWLQRRPIVIHEQTASYGRANKLSSYFADKIALARDTSARYYPRKKSKVIGNPILGKIARIAPKVKIGVPPTIYITGGSRGSVSINSMIEKILPKLLSDFIIIHQTGYLDFDKFQNIRSNIAKNLRDKYKIYKVIDPDKVDGIFKRADIVVSRAGANSVSDIIAAKRPALLIPLPMAYKFEQKENALFAEKYGIAKVLDQEILTPDRLFTEIRNLRNNWDKIIDDVKNKKSPDIYASRRLVDIIEGMIC